MRLSIVIPVQDEEGNVAELHRELTAALVRGSFESYQIIFVDDGSSDGTADRIAALNDPRVKLIRRPERGGQSAALKEGLAAAQYETVATMDGDLQHDPEDLNAMVRYLVQGWDFVQGRRRDRQDPWLKRASGWVANNVRRAVLWDDFHDIGCNFRLFRRACVDGLNFFDGAHRFLPLLVQRRGFRVVELDVAHRRRGAGRSKYGIRDRLVKGLRDLARLRFSR